MIADESGRYVLTQLNDKTLWRYDHRWRKVDTYEPYGDAGFSAIEGEHHVGLVSQPEAGGEIEVTVRSAKNPTGILATARFMDTWVFEGQSQMWAAIPEYFLTQKKDGSRGLLRIADDAEIDPLEDFEAVLSVEAVPNSRLVVIASPGAYTVYDPIATRAIRHFKLAGENPTPRLRFRNNDELWVNDVDTMLKIETRQFEEVLDAAGSDIEPSDIEPSEIGQEGVHGGFGRWNFARENELCVITRPSVGDVLVLDAISMLPVARGVFSTGVPLDVILVGRNSVVAVDAGANLLRTRVKRVAMRFETPTARTDYDGQERSPD